MCGSNPKPGSPLPTPTEADKAGSLAKVGNTYASKESNFAGHIWDRLDVNGQMGAIASVVVPSFWAKRQEQSDL